jgi:hypothetical protein
MIIRKKFYPIGLFILPDEQFNYPGETLIGAGKAWNRTNSIEKL